MKERSEQDRQTGDARRAGWERTGRRAARVLGLFHVSLWLMVFLIILQTGYLSWIGIAVGVLYLIPGFAAPLAGFAGKRRLEAFLSWLSAGEPLLVALVIGLASVWPEQDDGSWRPYSFERELAAIEATRTVPEDENAALRYDAVLAGVDVNDRPAFVSRAGRADGRRAETPSKSEDYAQAAQWLDLRADLIGSLMQVGTMEKCRWPVYANSDCRWTVPYRKVGYAIWLLTVAAQQDLGEGAAHQALEKSLCLLRIADHLYQQTHDVDFRTAFRCERTALQMLRYLLVKGKLSPQDLERIAHRLPPTADTWQQDTARLLVFDEFRFAQFLASIYEISGEGKVRFAASCRWLDEGKQEQEDFFLRSRIWRLYWLMNMPRRPERVWDMAHKESAALGSFLQQGPASCAAHAKDLCSPSFFDSVGKALGNVARCGAHALCLSEFLYACFAESYAGQMTERRATWLVLGLRRYRDTYGAWPQTLDAISEYVPAEAFLDPTNGGAFVYTLDGDSFKLYSKGPNRVDEGARHGYVKALDKIEDDIPIWPPPVPEPKDKLTDDELLKQMKEIYGPNYVETYRRDNGSAKP